MSRNVSDPLEHVSRGPGWEVFTDPFGHTHRRLLSGGFDLGVTAELQRLITI